MIPTTPRDNYRAPWGISVKLITGLFVLLLGGITFIGARSSLGLGTIGQAALVGAPLIALTIAALFTIRGYQLIDDALLVKRLNWQTAISLTGLQAVTCDPHAMSSSARSFGNGGLFCIAGGFRNKILGPYRAYATDPRRSVILKFTDSTLVITPDNPEEFAARVRQMAGLT